MKSASVSGPSSTRIGKRPWNSGIRSEGFATWKAPDAMNRMWSVRTIPCFVLTVRSLDDRKQVALHAFARDVGTRRALAAPGDLVDLVDEDDAGVLDALAGFGGHRFHVDEPGGLLLCEQLERLGNLDFPLTGLLRHHVGEEIFQVGFDLLHPLRAHDLHHRPAGDRELDLDVALVELPFAKHAAELVARVPGRVGLGGVRVGRLVHRGSAGMDPEPSRRQQDIEDAVFGELAGAHLDLLLLLFLDHGDGELHQVADHRLDVAADVADLGELRGFHLEEGCLRELGEPP